MVFSDKLFVQWRHVTALVPSLKYFYAYSHHYASVTNTPQCQCVTQNRTVLKYKEKIFVLMPLKSVEALSQSTRATRSPYQSIYSRKLPAVHLHERKTSLNKSLKYISQSNRCIRKQHNLLNDDFLLDQFLLGNNVPSPISGDKFSAKQNNKVLFSTRLLISSRTDRTVDRQPADDPKQKLQLLSEKISLEGSMFLGKTRPYHDFTIYTKGIKLYYEDGPKRSRYIVGGLRKYKLLVGLFRRFHRIWWIDPEVDVLGVHTNEDQGTVEVRWRICGWSRWGVLATCLLQMPTNQSCLDYVSTFYVNNDGQVHTHKLSKIQVLTDALPLKEKLQGVRQLGALSAMKSNLTLNQHNMR